MKESQYIKHLQDNSNKLPALSGTCQYALESIKSRLDELNALAAQIKSNPEKPAEDILWDVEWIARRIETLHRLFNEGYEKDGYFSEKEKAEMAKRKKAEAVK